jgi:trehalose utilization protein
VNERHPIRVCVWNEYVGERRDPTIAACYPDGIHAELAGGLRDELGVAVDVATATFEQPEHGLAAERLDATDVLLWWGHEVHERVADEVVERVCTRVGEGMGLVVLHSGHHSKPFKRLMGTSCDLLWREADDREVVWTVNPAHPIAEGLPRAFVIPQQEMYGELFDIPAPDELVFISSFSGGEVFRSGCCFARGRGRVFYFGPGHETFPIYRQAEVRRVIANAVRWAHQPRRSTIEPSTEGPMPVNWFEALDEEASR